MRTLVSLLFFLAIIAAQASDPLLIEYGFGNQQALGATVRADEQLRKGDVENALREVNTVLRSSPTFWPALYVRAKIWIRQRKWEAAVQDCNVGLKAQPSFIELAVIRAQANAGVGRYAASLAELDHVIRIRPNRPDAFSFAFEQRAWLRANCPDPKIRDPQKAVSDAKQACNIIQWKDANPIDTLAVTCAAAGDFDSGVRYEEQAMKTRDAAEMGKVLPEHLALFKQHRALR